MNYNWKVSKQHFFTLLFIFFQQKKEESSKNKRNSVQLLRIDQSPYLEEFETSNPLSNHEGPPLLATPINRRDETGSEGSRESSTSGDSRAATKSLLNSSLISAQSDVVLRRPRDGFLSPYVSTPVLTRHEDVDSARNRSATAHDVSAFRARQVRSEIFNDSDWSPGRLGRPRSMESLDKMPSSSSTLTPGDVGSGYGLPGEDGVAGTLPRTKTQGMMKHVSPAASPRGLRKPRWAQSSPNISPVVTRKEYPVSLEPLPPSPPSPSSSRRSASPRSSPVLPRKLEERPPARSPKHSPILRRKENTNTFSPPSGGARRTSMPNHYSQTLDTLPVRERAADPAKSKVSVQVITSTNTSDTNAAQPRSTATASSPFQDQVKGVPLEGVLNSSQTQRFNGDASSQSAPPYHERQLNGSSERREEPTASTPRGFQLQGSFTGDKNIKTTEPSWNNSQHLREKSSSGNRNDGPRAAQTGPAHSRERSLSGDRNSGLRIMPAVQGKPDRPSRDPAETGPVHSRSLSADRNSGLRINQAVQGKPDGPSRGPAETGPIHSRSLSTDRNEGLRASQRQGTLFVASSIPRQSVPVTAHYVTTGTVAKSEPVPVVTSGIGTSVYIDATGVKLSSTPAVSHGNRAEVSSSSVYAIVRDKRGEERVMSDLNNTPPSRDLSTPSRDQSSLPRVNPSLSNSTTPSPYSSPVSRNITPASRSTAVSETSSLSRYGASSLPRNGVVSNPVELKPSTSEQRDENRNDTKLQVNTAGVQEASKQNVSSVRARILEIEHQPQPHASQAHTDDDDDDDARSVTSQHSRDCSPALRKVRSKARKAAKEKEIFADSLASSDTGSTASGRRSSAAADERSRTRSVGAKETEGKKSSVWYEYGCV